MLNILYMIRYKLMRVMLYTIIYNIQSTTH
jgi:hypothetical protein